MQVWDVVFDLEANNLLNNNTVDYTKVPYSLKDTFKMHCIVADVVVAGKQYIYAFYDGETISLDGRKYSIEIEGQEYILENYNPIEYIHKPMQDFKAFVEKLPEGSTVVGHNIINFDLLVTKLYFGIDYSVEVDMAIDAPLGDDRWGNKHVIFDDTLVRAKTLNPDRFGGQSLDALSQKCGVQKVQFRKHLPEDKRFQHFAPDMLYYCIYDVKANRQVRNLLNEEQKQFDWNDKWNSAIKLEKAVAELITRQEHRGFYFDKELAMKNLEELDAMMEERRVKIEAILPKKPATKSYLSNFIPCEKQFLKNGNPNANITKFVEKHGGTLENTTSGWVANIFDKVFPLPIPQEPIVEAEVPANVGDTTHIKNWLVGLGWKPSEYKEKDITTDTKKNKLPQDKLNAAIERYIEQTVTTNFRQDRCDHLLGYRVITEKTSESVVRNKLKNFFDSRTNQGRGVKVLTNPSFTVGQEKEICSRLTEFAKSNEKYASILDIVEYLTYRHRRNSILGGGLDYEDFDTEDDAQTAKGYLANVREDGRIPTPSDTCGAATSRFKHRLVANIPRVTSLYGENMRAMFGVDKDCYQIGYDFDSLEARQEANFCWKYEEEPREYCQSLLLDKPNDVHTKMSQKITEIIGKAFARGPAKSVKYACLPMDTKVLTTNGWKYFPDICIGDSLLSFNSEEGYVELDTVLDKHFFNDKVMYDFSNKYDSFRCTEDHRWYGWRRSKTKGKPSKNIFGYFEAKDFTQEHNIVLSAPWVGNEQSSLSDLDCKLLGWLASDGYWSWSKKEEVTSSSFGTKKEVFSSISQAKSKFYRQLEQLLEEMGVLYWKGYKELTNGNTVFNYKISSKWMRPFLDRVLPGRKDKHDVDWVKLVLSMSKSNLKCFYDTFYLGDGNTKGDSEIISQNLGNIFDGITTAALLLGDGRVTFNSKGNTPSPMKSIRVQKRKHLTCQELSKNSLGVQESFCLTTNNSSFLIWQGGFIGITGNCTYGAQGAKIAKTIGSDLSTGDTVFNAFWEAAAPLKKLKDALGIEWNKFDKKRIIGIDGRLVPTRSAHAVLNSKFQSSGVICAKRAMVLHDRKLQAENLIVDFFKDNLDGKEWCQQLIGYHDEAQSEVSKKSVMFKMFSTEEECKVFKEEQLQIGKIWSDIKPNPKGGFFVAYCRAGELAVESVGEAGNDYGMNVSLTAGYMLGLNWKMCH